MCWCQYQFRFSRAEWDCGLWSALFDGCYETAVGAVDARGVFDDFGDAHVGYVFGADDAVEARGLHLFAAEAEEGCMGMSGAEFRDELCAVVVAAGFAG